ncbi:MAG: hypothetical protein EXR54_07810 [Dehalococcoidia bacterium]|nr:hypothetical protein [Dehalococcoidia bacterium]MSQ17450.1 hypothetical protein [Dehalococcoidia bacterium]
MTQPRNAQRRATAEPPGLPARRRQDRSSTPPEPRRPAAHGGDQEKRKQRLAITIFVMLLMAIAAIMGIGYYKEFYQPPRVMAGEIREVRFTMGDLVQRIRVLQGINRYQGGRIDLSRVPFEILQSMLNAEILRQASPGLAITVTEEDITQALRNQFFRAAEPGQTTDPGQLEQEYKNRQGAFLTQTGLEEKDYRVILEESLALNQLRLYWGAQIQDPQEQVEVEWVHLEPNTTLKPLDVRKRLDTEEVAVVAEDVGSPDGYANVAGYVGWVPKGAFPDLDDVLYGIAEPPPPAATDPGTPTPMPAPAAKPPLAAGAISDPVFTQQGVYIIRKISGPESKPLADNIRGKLNTELVLKWQNEQLRVGSAEGWLKMNLNSDLYAWVADQVQVTAPRVPPPADPNQ